jgi:hypothetical protein
MDQAALNDPPAPRRKAPISAHRLFPLAVALWCAAALGLSTLVLPVAALEGLVALSGIDRLVPAAAPPLGMTARVLVVLGLGGIGALAGLVAALMVRPSRVRARTPASETQARLPGRAEPVVDDVPHLRPRDRHPDAPARKPISATIDLQAHATGEEADGKDAEASSPAPRQPVQEAAATPSSHPSPLARAALDTLGLVELTERLAIAMAERRARGTGGPRPLALPPLRARGSSAGDPGTRGPDTESLRHALASLQRVASSR